MDICLQLSKRLEKVDKKINTYICLKYMVFEKLRLNMYYHIIIHYGKFWSGHSTEFSIVYSQSYSKYCQITCLDMMELSQKRKIVPDWNFP